MSAEFKVGFLFLAGVGALFVLTVLVSDVPIFKAGYEFDVLFADAAGLDKGDRVLVSGVVVGEVNRVDLTEDGRVKVHCRVSRDGVRIPIDSEFTIRHSSLLGGLAVYITPGRSATTVKQRPTVEGLPPQDIVSSLTSTSESIGELVRSVQSKLDDVVADVRKAIKTLTEGEGTIPKLMSDKALYEDLKKTVSNLRKVSDNLNEGKGTVGRLLVDESLYDEATSLVKDIKDAVADAKKVVGDFRSSYENSEGIFKLIKEEDVYRSLKKAAADVEALTSKVKGALEGDSILNQLLKPGGGQLFDDLSGAFADLGSVMKDIKEGDGPLPALIRDKEMAKDLKETIKSVRNVTARLDEQYRKGTLLEGIIGKKLVRKTEKVITDAEAALAPMARLRVYVGLGGARYELQKETAGSVWLRLQPTRHRYFLLGGTFFQMDEDSPVSFDYTRQQAGHVMVYPTFQLAWLFTLREGTLGKEERRAGHTLPLDRIVLTARGGLLEGKGGAGVDVDFLRYLRLTIEARDTHTDWDRYHEHISPFLLRATVGVRIGRIFWVYLGGSNLLDRAEVCGGITIEWEDRDIRSIVSVAGLMQ